MGMKAVMDVAHGADGSMRMVFACEHGRSTVQYEPGEPEGMIGRLFDRLFDTHASECKCDCSPARLHETWARVDDIERPPKGALDYWLGTAEIDPNAKYRVPSDCHCEVIGFVIDATPRMRTSQMVHEPQCYWHDRVVVSAPVRHTHPDRPN